MTYEESVISALDDVGKYFRRLCYEEIDPETYAKYYSMMSIVSQASNLIEELMEKQEPRVLTLEEVKNLGDHDVVYLETTIGDPINPAIYQPDNGDDDYACIVSTWLKSGFYSWSTYGKEWRCWSSRPTDEQREAVPWTE